MWLFSDENSIQTCNLTFLVNTTKLNHTGHDGAIFEDCACQCIDRTALENKAKNLTELAQRNNPALRKERNAQNKI